MEYRTREMTLMDWQSVAAIYKQGVDTNKATFQTIIPEYEAWDAAHLKVCRFVMTWEEEVIGWAALSPISSRCVYAGVCELSIYIHNDFKGKGVGTKLLQYMITESEENNIWTIQAGIMEDNVASIVLHKKCGFREVGYREKIGKDKEGRWRSTVLMERRSTLDKFC